MRRNLIIFAKEPEARQVKTRLKGYLTNGQRVSLYKAFLKDTIELAEKVKCDVRVLAYESAGKKPDYLQSIAKDFVFYKQKGKDLGLRMHNAFRFAAGAAIIIGSDSPTLPQNFIEEAFGKLDNNDLVIGPAYDGGFYLLGLKKPELALFNAVEWSSHKVLGSMIKNAIGLEKKIAILNRWYDIDRLKDLVRLEYDLEEDKRIVRWTRKFLITILP